MAALQGSQDGCATKLPAILQPMPRGWFITFEGGEGTGKSTQIERLAGRLRERGREVVVTREPGGTPLAEGVRALLLDPAHELDGLTEIFLLEAARHDHVERVIRPALEAGAVVISDRYLDSTLAYQGHGGQLGVEELRPVGRFATGGLRPDLTILFDVPVEVGLARKSDAETTRFEAHFDLAFHERVRAGYLARAAAEPDRWVVVDATAPEEDVLAAARSVLVAFLDRVAPAR